MSEAERHPIPLAAKVRVTFHDQQYWEGTAVWMHRDGLMIEPVGYDNDTEAVYAVFFPWSAIRHVQLYKSDD